MNYLLFLLIPLTVFAADFQVEMTLSSEKVRLDDSLFVTLTVTHPPGYTVNQEELVGKLTSSQLLAEAPFAFVGVKQLEKTRDQETIRFELDPQIVGRHFLTFYEIPFYTDGKTVEKISPVLSVEVVSNPVDPLFRPLPEPLLTFEQGFPIGPNSENRLRLLEPSDIQGRLEQKQLPWIPILFICALPLLLIRFKPKLESEEKRLSRVKKEMKERLQKATDIKQISNLVRSYFEKRYGIHAQNQTSKEFLETLAATDKQMETRLRPFLTQADLAKFAAYTPTLEEQQEAKKLAAEVIEA